MLNDDFMKPDAIIFDMDGTLWDASQATARGWNKGLAFLGSDKRLSAKDIQSVAGKPYEDCVELLLPGFIDRYPTLIDVLQRHEELEVGKQGGIFYEDVFDGVRRLSSRYQLFLISNCQDWYLDIFFGFSKLKSSFKDFDCYGLSRLTKEPMLKRIKANYFLQTPVYIGDTSGDEEAARAAGIDFCHVVYGFGIPTQPCLSFNSFRELTHHFLPSLN